jgi:septal ring factor EnvC (AmiA/AmiB activator)
MGFKKARGVIPWKQGDELPEDAIARQRGHNEAWEKEINRLRGENAKLRTELDEMNKPLNSYREGYKKLRAELEQARKELENAKGQLDIQIELDGKIFQRLFEYQLKPRLPIREYDEWSRVISGGMESFFD